MKDEFDLRQIAEVPDPLPGLSDVAAPPRRAFSTGASPTRSTVAAIRGAALGAALVYEGAWLMLMNKRPDLHTMDPLVLFIEVSVPIGVALLALAAALPGDQGLGKPKGRVATLALMAPALFVGTTLLLSSTVAGEVDNEPFWLHCLRCFAWTSVYSAGPMVLAVWAFWRAFVVSAAWRAAAVAIACTAAGAATMSLICSVGTPAHVLVGHGGPMLVAALLVFFARRIGIGAR